LGWPGPSGSGWEVAQLPICLMLSGGRRSADSCWPPPGKTSPGSHRSGRFRNPRGGGPGGGGPGTGKTLAQCRSDIEVTGGGGGSFFNRRIAFADLLSCKGKMTTRLLRAKRTDTPQALDYLVPILELFADHGLPLTSICNRDDCSDTPTGASRWLRSTTH
jgi:hypothetical protein